MSRRSRRQFKNNQKFLKSHIPTVQSQVVQGPQRPGAPPAEATVITAADLGQKYLGQGLVGYSAYLQVITNATANDLILKHGYNIFREMQADSEVNASITAFVQAPNSQPSEVNPQIMPGEEGYEKAKQICDFVSWNFRRLNIDAWKRDALRTAIVFGNSVSEIDWDIAQYGPYQDKFIIRRLRRQEPENYGFIMDRWGEVYGVAPINEAAGTFFPLGNLIPLEDHHAKLLQGAVPRYKLSIWTWDQKGTDPRGTSMLIPAYVPWWGKQRAIEEWSCWLGRYAQPSIWATPGPNAVPLCITNPNGSQTITQPTELLLQALLQFRSGSALALPFGSVVNLLTAEGTIDPFLKSIETFNTEITRAILGQHLATSEGSVAGKAGAQLHAYILRQLISYGRQIMSARIQEDLIKPLVQANYGIVDDKYYPVVNLGDDDGFPPTITEVAVLFQAGYFSEDQLAYVDRKLGFPVRQTLNRVGAGNLPNSEPSAADKPSTEDPSGRSDNSTNTDKVVGEEDSKEEDEQPPSSKSSR